jgi:acyl carrier protein
MNEDGEQQKETIHKKVVEVLREVLILEPDEPVISPGTRFVEDLGAESLDMAQFVMSLEEEFEQSIEDEQLMDLKTVQDAVDYIQKKSTESES